MPLLYSSLTTLPLGRRQIRWRRDVIVFHQDPMVLPFLQPAGSVDAVGFTCLLLTLPLPPLATKPSVVCRILPRPPANPDRLHCQAIVVSCNPGPSQSSLSPAAASVSAPVSRTHRAIPPPARPLSCPSPPPDDAFLPRTLKDVLPAQRDADRSRVDRPHLSPPARDVPTSPREGAWLRSSPPPPRRLPHLPSPHSLAPPLLPVASYRVAIFG